MRKTFAYLFAVLGLLSALTWWVQPPATVHGKTILNRLSDTNPLREQQVKLFNDLHPKLSMQIQPASGGVEQVIVQSIGGVGPDVFDAFNPFQLVAYVHSGIVWDITDELKKRGVDVRKQTFTGIQNTAIFNGRVYGVPTNIAADGIWFHRDTFKEEGIPEHHGPWQWPEFIEVAKKLTKRDARGKPIRYGFFFDWWNWAHFFKGFGAKVYNESGTVCTVDSPEAVQAVQMMHDLVYKYKVSSTPVEEAAMATAGGFGSGNMSVFGSRHAAMALGGRWWLAQLRTYKDIDLGVMESPYGLVRRFHSYGRATLINKDSPHREECLEYLLYMAGPEYNNLVNDQADGICAFRQYASGPRFDFNPAYPKEKDNRVWKDITDLSEADEVSPYVNGQVVSRIMKEQLDLVQSNQKPVPAAMRDAAAQINEAIQKEIAGDPALAERYRQAVKVGSK